MTQLKDLGGERTVHLISCRNCFLGFILGFEVKKGWVFYLTPSAAIAHPSRRALAAHFLFLSLFCSLSTTQPHHNIPRMAVLSETTPQPLPTPIVLPRNLRGHVKYIAGLDEEVCKCCMCTCKLLCTRECTPPFERDWAYVEFEYFRVC